MSGLLQVNDVSKRFGGVKAVDGVTFSIEQPSVVGLIGPNGSGKTTLLGILSGTHAPTSGDVVLNGTVVSGKKPHQTVHAGVARTFQTSRLFSTWTLRDSMRIAATESRQRDDGKHSAESIAELLGLAAVLERRCADLTSAQQRLSMIAVALSTGPRVLLLDEPAVGMDLDEALALASAVRRVQTELDVAVIVVDHNMHFLMPLAQTILVMAAGKILASGAPAEVRANKDVIASYLGS